MQKDNNRFLIKDHKVMVEIKEEKLYSDSQVNGYILAGAGLGIILSSMIEVIFTNSLWYLIPIFLGFVVVNIGCNKLDTKYKKVWVYKEYKPTKEEK